MDVAARPPGIDAGRVTGWVADHVPGAVAPFTFELIAGGHSNLTFRVTGADGTRFVLRRPPLGSVLPSAHDMGREFRVIAALATTPVPVPSALAYCEDGSVTGAPFYVMGFVDGIVARDRADVDDAMPVAARAHAANAIADTLAAIHAVDPDAVGLGDLGRHEGYIARQLKRWYAQWNATKLHEQPLIDEVHDALARRIPPDPPAAIVHGDYRLDNCMVSPGGDVLAVLDWEICTLGDPLADVGLLLVYWTGPHDTPSAAWSGAATAPGFPDRAELAERYALTSGRDVSGIDFYWAFGFWKLACILEGVHARYLAGGLGEGDPSRYATFRDQVDSAARLAAATLERVP